MAVSNGFSVVGVSDAHTAADRPMLPVETLIQYRNWLWANLIPNPSVNVAGTADFLAAS